MEVGSAQAVGILFPESPAIRALIRMRASWITNQADIQRFSESCLLGEAELVSWIIFCSSLTYESEFLPMNTACSVCNQREAHRRTNYTVRPRDGHLEGRCNDQPNARTWEMKQEPRIMLASSANKRTFSLVLPLPKRPLLTPCLSDTNETPMRPLFTPLNVSVICTSIPETSNQCYLFRHVSAYSTPVF